MIYLFTDFGSADLYVGQVKARLAQCAAGIPVVDLLHDAPPFNIEAGAHLLCALAGQHARGSVTLAVVDPGVGTARRPVVLRADGAWFVGPDNGLLSVLAARSTDSAVWEITWRPGSLSRSFHGRDLFAPIAGRIAASGLPTDAVMPVAHLDVRIGAADLAAVIYIDHYGNAMTGLRGADADGAAALRINGRVVSHAEVFGAAAPKQAFWYVNSIGLVEVAMDRDSAAEQLGLRIGDAVGWTP